FTACLLPTLLLRDRLPCNPGCAVANKIHRLRFALAPRPGQPEKLPAARTRSRLPARRTKCLPDAIAFLCRARLAQEDLIQSGKPPRSRREPDRILLRPRL